MMVSVLQSAVESLAHFLYAGLQQGLEPIRLARAGCALLSGGCSVRGTFPGYVLPDYVMGAHRADGGWADVEETLWCLAYLAAFREAYEAQMERGMGWLATVRLPCGAWGRTERDQPRIPITALVAALVPGAVGSDGLEWLEHQWREDLASPTQLTYKGAFYLLGQAHGQTCADSDLVARTIAYLAEEQGEDGGFGPWKGHPLGSDPWSTGVVLWGLSRVVEPVPMRTIERAVGWLERRQLPNGLWAYHYMDEGTAMALIGLSNTLPILAKG